MENNEIMLSNGVALGSSMEILASNTIKFGFEGEEFIRLTKDGFYYKGKLIEEDKEIYQQFKNWIDMATKK